LGNETPKYLITGEPNRRHGGAVQEEEEDGATSEKQIVDLVVADWLLA
jgi:hypothetical protein